MSPFLVFNRVCRLEIQSVMLVFSNPLVKYCPSKLIVHIASYGLGYTLYVHIAGGGKRYTLPSFPNCGWWKWTLHTPCMSIPLAVERDTPYTFVEKHAKTQTSIWLAGA
jgi:hypothetical protein